MPEPVIPSSFQYRETGLLAEGGMALVSQAVRNDGLEVVIKRIRPPLCFDAGYLRLFHDEGRVHRALAHPNIVHLIDEGEDEQGPFLVFEHVDGIDLQDLLDDAHEKGVPLDVEVVLAFAVPLFAALAAAHSATLDGAAIALVHRDISPANLLLSKNGEVKLADFGVASSTLRSDATVAGEMKGKFAYMAPEQTRGEQVTHRSDLFSAGILLWEALHNQRLFDAATDADIVQMVRNKEAPGPLSSSREVPLGLLTLTTQLLQKDPALRPVSALAVLERLRALCLELGLDEGLQRAMARAVRVLPPRVVAPVVDDNRRRTHRVPALANAATVVRAPSVVRKPLRALWAALGLLLGLVVAFLVVSLVWRPTTTTPVTVQALPDDKANDAGNAAAEPAPISREPEKTASTSNPSPNNDKPSTKPLMPRPRPAVLQGTPRPAPLTTTPAATTTSTTPPVAATTPMALPAAKVLGRLFLSSEPWASVTIDGVPTGHDTPLLDHPLAVGHHTLTLRNDPARLSRTVEVDIVDAVPVRRFVNLRQP